MKKFLACFLSLTMILLAGCAPQPTPAETASTTEHMTQAPADDTVSTPEALVAALKPGASITLAPGTYDLTQVPEGLQSNGPCRWAPRTGALVLRDLEDVTIRGEGAELLLGSGEEAPLILENCSGIRLEGLSLRGRDPDSFSALLLRSCRDIHMEGLTLEVPSYACADFQGSSNVTVQNCLFTGSARTALSIEGCEDVNVTACELRDLGRLLPEAEKVPLMPDFQALIRIGSWGSADSFLQSTGVTVADCTVENCTSGLLAHVDSSRKVFLRDNLFTGCRMEEAAFCIWTAQPHIYGNTYRDNEPWVWYYPSSSLAVDEQGADMTPDRFAAAIPIPKAGQQKEVHVSNATEFLEAIGPDTRILLDCGLLDLSTAPDYGTGSSDYYFWKQAYDGPILVITQVNNLTIAAQNPDRTAHTISAVPRYADVLAFQFCTNLTLENITCGHTVEPGDCMGGVLSFRECRRTTVRNCGLYGCGILGIRAHSGEDLKVLDCDIYECSQGGLSLQQVNGVTIENTTFRDLGGEAISIRDCKNAVLDGGPIPQD